MRYADNEFLCVDRVLHIGWTQEEGWYIYGNAPFSERGDDVYYVGLTDRLQFVDTARYYLTLPVAKGYLALNVETLIRAFAVIAKIESGEL
jgi:hypothetical protein